MVAAQFQVTGYVESGLQQQQQQPRWGCFRDSRSGSNSLPARRQSAFVLAVAAPEKTWRDDFIAFILARFVP